MLREFSPEEVTSNIYTMVDVLLHQIQIELQRGHLIQVYFLICVAGIVINQLEFIPFILLLMI